MSTAARPEELVHTKDYHGPCRRRTSEEKREQYLVERKLRMDLLNAIGRKAILGVFVLSAFWVGRVERHLATADEAMQTLVTTVETVRNLAESVSKLQDHERKAVEDRTAMLLELQKLNGQIQAMRIEEQARTVRGEGR
jgi:hypothetical protein